MSKVIATSCLGLALFVFAIPAKETIAAEVSFPTRAIRIVVPFSAGGSTDLLARAVGRHFNDVWKQPVIIENKPGGGGILAMRSVLDAPSDGYALLVHSDGFSIAPAIYPQLPFNPSRDFKPIALLARTTNVVAVGANSPYRSISDLVAAGKSSAQLTFASAGVGSAQHMQAAKFSTTAKLKDPIHVPFRGTPEGLTEVITSRVDFVFAPLSNAIPLLKSGELRSLAVSSALRSPFLPDVPTIDESGFPGFAEEQWWGLFAPSNVPSDILVKIENETRVAMGKAEMQRVIHQLSSESGKEFTSEFSKVIETSIAANKAAAKEANIQVK